jgi:hypothetical protein
VSVHVLEGAAGAISRSGGRDIPTSASTSSLQGARTGWQHYAVEINLREGGTSHPWGTLWLLTQGTLDPQGIYRATSGQKKYYFATDALSNPAYGRIGHDEFLSASSAEGVAYDVETQTVAVFHISARPRRKAGLASSRSEIRQSRPTTSICASFVYLTSLVRRIRQRDRSERAIVNS